MSNEKSLTPQEKARCEKFDNLCNEMRDKGYTEKLMIVSALKVNLMVFVTSMPIIIVCYFIYSLIHGNNQIINSLGSVTFILAYFIGIVAHEIIHGLVWSLFCKNKWRAINFGVIWKYLTPYCTCNECLAYRSYALGAIMPTILLGAVPYIISLIIGNHTIMLFSMFFILGGGGDIYILWLIRKQKKAIFIDHPYLPGCVAFENNKV